MNIYVREFCDKHGEVPDTSMDRRHARLRITSSNGKFIKEVIVSRKVLPENTKTGDKLEFINITRSK